MARRQYFHVVRIYDERMWRQLSRHAAALKLYPRDILQTALAEYFGNPLRDPGEIATRLAKKKPPKVERVPRPLLSGVVRDPKTGRIMARPK